MKIFDNGTLRDATAEEEARITAERALEPSSAERKLAKIREMRLQKLQATDWMSLGDVTMPDYIKTWRQTLRDLPQNNTTESQYDTLLVSSLSNSFIVPVLVTLSSAIVYSVGCFHIA